MSSHSPYRFIIAFALLAVAACAPRATVRQEAPCSDAIYLELKAEPPDSLSEREWTRLQELERACATTRGTAEPADRGGMMGMGRRSWVAMAVGVLAMGAMGLFMWH